MADLEVKHQLVMLAPDDPAYENKPSDWNALHTLVQIGERMLGKPTAGNGPTEVMDGPAVRAFAGAELAGAAVASMAGHLADGDPHPQYLTTAEGDAAYDPLGIAAATMAAHLAAGDPHPQYLTEAEGDASYDAIGAAAAAVAAHEAAGNPHPQYLTEAEGDAAYDELGAAAAVAAVKQDDIQFQDEGSNLGTAGTATEVDFTGAGVTASRATNKITVNIPGGAGSDPFVGSFAPGSFTLEDGKYAVIGHKLVLNGTEALTMNGDSTLVITG